MAPIQEGSQSIPPQAFERWNDPRGAALLALNRDGTVFCQGVRFGDGTEQTTAGGTGIDVVAYGADPSGVNDSTSAIQAALNAVPVGGGTVYFPAGSYIISSTLQVSISGTVLQGIGTGSTTANGSRIVAASGLVTPPASNLGRKQQFANQRYSSTELNASGRLHIDAKRRVLRQLRQLAFSECPVRQFGNCRRFGLRISCSPLFLQLCNEWQRGHCGHGYGPHRESHEYGRTAI